MKKLQEKIMNANFGRLFKRWVIAVLCVVLLGGGISAALLSPQIREAVTTMQTIHQQSDQRDHTLSGDASSREEAHRDHFEADDIFSANVTRPSTGAVLSVGITVLLCGLLILAFWLLTAAWLDQAAELSGMSGPLWGVLGLLSNVFAAALFLLVRRSRRRKCPSCGRWQDRETAYCSVCGSAMDRQCPDCGAHCPMDSRFCPACGMKLEADELEGSEI